MLWWLHNEGKLRRPYLLLFTVNHLSLGETLPPELLNLLSLRARQNIVKDGNIFQDKIALFFNTTCKVRFNWQPYYYAVPRLIWLYIKLWDSAISIHKNHTRILINIWQNETYIIIEKEGLRTDLSLITSRSQAGEEGKSCGWEKGMAGEGTDCWQQSERNPSVHKLRRKWQTCCSHCTRRHAHQYSSWESHFC